MDISESIEAGEDFLAHYGVLGMKWGRRKDRNAASQKSESDAKRARTIKSASSRETKAAEKRKRAIAVQKAIDKKYSKESTAIRDDRSEKTIKLGRAATGTALGALGTATVSILSRDPRVTIGAGLVSIALSSTSFGLSAKTNRSAEDDALAKYGS